MRLAFILLLLLPNMLYALTFAEAAKQMRDNGATITHPGLNVKFKRVDISCVSVPVGYIKEGEAYMRLNSNTLRAAFELPSVGYKYQTSTNWSFE